MYDITLGVDGWWLCEFWANGDYYSTRRATYPAAREWVNAMIAKYGEAVSA